MQIAVTHNIRDVARRLDDIGRRQLPFAAAKALTLTAKRVEKRLQDEMRGALTSATPYTLKSQYVKPATKRDLVAEVGIKDRKPARGTAPAVLLKEHFTGGARGNKPMEVALRARRALPPGYVVVPGAGMPLDAYGNPKRAAVAEVLGALKAGINVYSKRGKRMSTVGYFVVPIGSADPRTRHLEPGIYRRVTAADGRAAIPVFLFVQRADYRKRIDLPRLARETVAREFDGIFADALRGALQTAR